MRHEQTASSFHRILFDKGQTEQITDGAIVAERNQAKFVSTDPERSFISELPSINRYDIALVGGEYFEFEVIEDGKPVIYRAKIADFPSDTDRQLLAERIITGKNMPYVI